MNCRGLPQPALLPHAESRKAEPARRTVSTSALASVILGDTLCANLLSAVGKDESQARFRVL